MQVNFHSKEALEVQTCVMEGQPDGPCVRLRLKADREIVDYFVRNVDDAYALFNAAEHILDYFEA